MKAIDIRNKYLKFFESKGHSVIPSAPLIPENDPSVLFTTAGMQPLVPYLLGQKHPAGTRLTDYQKCVRTNDIEEVGDNRHLTYFEMLGNWSLGDYFKEESIQMSFDFLTKEVEKFKDKKEIPTCECGGVIKPDVVLYGEALPEDVVEGSIEKISECDTLIVGGTSLNVYPAAGLINYFRGKNLVVINKEKLNIVNALEINENIGEVFSKIKIK